MTREEREHAIRCLESECEDTDYSFGCKRKCKTDGSDCFIKTEIKSLEAWDEVISWLEYRITVSDKCFGKTNESYYAGKSRTFEEAIEAIKQKLGEVENDRLG